MRDERAHGLRARPRSATPARSKLIGSKFIRMFGRSARSSISRQISGTQRRAVVVLEDEHHVRMPIGQAPQVVGDRRLRRTAPYVRAREPAEEQPQRAGAETPRDRDLPLDRRERLARSPAAA